MKHQTGNLVAIYPGGREEVLLHDAPWAKLQHIKKVKYGHLKGTGIKLVTKYTFTKINQS